MKMQEQGLMPGQEPTQEEVNTRSEHRKRVLKRGMLGFGEQYAGQPCIVRDMSNLGARIELQNIIALPKQFSLHVEIDGFQIDCRLVWQKPPFAGVVFTGTRRRSMLAREQVLRDEEHALSPEYLAEFEKRQALEHKDQPQDLTYSASAARLRRAAIRPKPFGKRAFSDNR